MLIAFIYKGLKETFGGDVCINYWQPTHFNIELDTDVQTVSPPVFFRTNFHELRIFDVTVVFSMLSFF